MGVSGRSWEAKRQAVVNAYIEWLRDESELSYSDELQEAIYDIMTPPEREDANYAEFEDAEERAKRHAQPQTLVSAADPIQSSLFQLELPYNAANSTAVSAPASGVCDASPTKSPQNPETDSVAR